MVVNVFQYIRSPQGVTETQSCVCSITEKYAISSAITEHHSLLRYRLCGRNFYIITNCGFIQLVLRSTMKSHLLVPSRRGKLKSMMIRRQYH